VLPAIYSGRTPPFISAANSNGLTVRRLKELLPEI
jgi:hypothetical protein